MAITGENLFNEYRNIVNADTADTFVTVTAGGSAQGKIISFLNIVNQDTISHTVTLSFDRYAGSYASVFTKSYLVAAGESKIAVDFMIPLIAGANPDRIQAKTAVQVSSGKKVTIMACGPDFS